MIEKIKIDYYFFARRIYTPQAQLAFTSAAGLWYGHCCELGNGAAAAGDTEVIHGTVAEDLCCRIREGVIVHSGGPQ